MSNEPAAELSDPSSGYQATIRMRAAQITRVPLGDDAVGTTPDPAVIGDYELLHEIARGGMGIVYKARQRKLKRLVALKVTKAGLLAEPEEVLRLQAEATAAAKLDHPNIVPIYESGEAEGRRFLSMAFIEGENLSQALAAGPLPPRRSAELIMQVARAVAYAHQQGVIHRDLKPSNILLDLGGQPRISDFGLAKCAETDSGLTQTGQIMGTPSFMAPEQAVGRTELVGPLADVYALGATLYCLVTGRPPFHAATPMETIKQLVEREPISPRYLNPAVDRDLDTICLKCLQKRPERRYASATDLADDLQRFLDRQPIQARPVRRAEWMLRWCRRNPYVAGSIASVLSIVLIAFLLVSWSYLRAERALQDEKIQKDLAKLHEKLAKENENLATQNEKDARWALYRANIVAAASAIRLHGVAAAHQLLDDAPAQHRNWEWHHFQNQLDLSQHVLRGRQARVANSFITPDGARVFMYGFDNVGRVWDVAARRTIAEFPVPYSHESKESRDGSMYSYVVKERTVVVKHIDNGKNDVIITGHDKNVHSMRFSGDNKLLATGSHDGTARIWDPHTGQQIQVYRKHTGQVSIIGFTPDCRRVISVDRNDFECHLWEATTGKQVANLVGHRTHAWMVEFSPGGDRLVTVESFPTNTMRLWDTATGKLLGVMTGHINRINSATFSPDGTLIASCGMDQTVRLWSGLDGSEIATLRGHNGWVHCVRFSRHGKHLISCSQDQTVRLWDIASATVISVLHGHTGEVFSLEYSADGTSIISAAYDGTIRLWDANLAANHGVLRGHTNFVYGVAFHPDGQRVASAAWDGTVRLWDATAGKQLASLDYDDKKLTVSSVAFHPGGKLIASLARDGAVRIWDLATFKQVQCLSIATNHWRDSRVAFSPLGDMLAAGNKDGQIYLWQAPADLPPEQAWQKPLEPTVLYKHELTVRDVAFSPNGRWLAAAADDQNISIWDVASKKLVQVLKKHSLFVYALAWSSDGKLLASGSTDGTVRLWDTATWQESAVLKHGTNVYCVAFTPDGTRLATACADNTIRFWDVASHKAVAELRGHESYVHSLAFSSDGTRLATASGDFNVRIWDTFSAQERARGKASTDKRSARRAHAKEVSTACLIPWQKLGPSQREQAVFMILPSRNH